MAFDDTRADRDLDDVLRQACCGRGCVASPHAPTRTAGGAMAGCRPAHGHCGLGASGSIGRWPSGTHTTRWQWAVDATAMWCAITDALQEAQREALEELLRKKAEREQRSEAASTVGGIGKHRPWVQDTL